MAEAKAEYLYVSGNLADRDDRRRLVEEAVRRFQRIDVLVNNAGVAPKERKDLLDMVLNRAARLLEISEDGTKMLSDPELIWGGSMKHTAEGPHLLKHNGYYYCFLAEGGTGEGHRVTVARSEKLCGPYEDCPYNPILRQTDTAGVLQCTGHGMD